MKPITHLILLPVLAAFVTCINAQTYVNEEWSSLNGLPVNRHWSASMMASSGHLMTVGNTFTSGESTNMLLTKYETNGTLVWQVEYNNDDNLEDYGIAITEDNAGNFYLAGTSYRLSSSSLELVVVKYNSSGQYQWAYEFNGTANGDDLPSAIATDGNDVFVTGGTESTGAGSDMITLKLLSNGTLSWSATYDHNYLDDAAAKIIVKNNGDVAVTGSGADQPNVVDIITLTYDGSGNLSNTHTGNYNIGIDQPTAFGTDTNGNIVIGGYFQAGTDVQFSLLSLNDTLDLNWDTLYNPSSGEDKLMDLAVTQDGNIFVTGHKELASGDFACYTALFESGGDLAWTREYQAPKGSAFGKKLSIDPSGHVNITGMSISDTDTNIITLQYSQSGRLRFAQARDAAGAEVAANIETDFWGNIYVHGTSSINGGGYVTLKYGTLARKSR